MAEAAVLASVGWLAAPMIKMVIDKVHHHLGTGIKRRKEKLEATVLPTLLLVIEKAEKSPNKRKLVDWLRRLKGAYYEAEEAIDLFEYELLKQKVKDDRKTLKHKAKNEKGTPISLPLKFVPLPIKIASVKLKYGLSVFSPQKKMLKRCIDNLIKIAEEAKDFPDLLGGPQNANGSDADRETISEPPVRVFGREIDKENIVSLLMKKPSNYEPGPSTRPAIPIIAITGRSGVGKTALAQYVNKHMDGHGHFDIHVWVHAPRKFKTTDVIKSMIQNLEAKEGTPNNNPSTSFEALLTQIRHMLGPKKLLLVLDDFWSDNEDFVAQWENFIISFLSSCLPGSKILLTTQNKNAAEHARLAGVTEVETYNLEEIEESQFLELFMHYAWPSNSNFPKEEFEIIGRKIAVKLKGDPGAAKLVGHQLSGKLDLRIWEEVAEKDWLGDNMKARIWSYQQLPLDLQRCFAIGGLFVKGTWFPRKLLIDLWMAEGFISPVVKQERLEDIGEKYLDELVSRFFFEQVDRKGEYYQLHDLLHDLAERVQGDDFIRMDSTNCRELPSHIRHIYLPSSMVDELKEKLYRMKNICTFWVKPDGGFVSEKVLQEIFKNMKKLRVLSLQDCVVHLPDSIGNLKHLRFLDIYSSRPIKKLPDSICKLYHLQTLALKNCESLPNDFSELISLRRFVTVGETMSHISDVGRMTSLQNLDRFDARKKAGHELHQLENLNQLRGEMRITGLENVGSRSDDAVKAKMRDKKHLEKLEFEWNFDEGDTGNVTSLSTQHVQLLEELQPHSNITALTLRHFGGDRLPDWLLMPNLLNKLMSLALMDCDKVEEISSIDESLPNCRSLILQGLENLKIMPSLPPNLTYLVVKHIPRLSYFSEDDLLIKEERKQSKHEVVEQISERVKLEYVPLPAKFVELKQFEYNFSDDDYSSDQLLFEWAELMHSKIETMFNENEVSKLVLPSSLTHLEISSCSITDDALSTCIIYLASLSKLKLSDIQTITSLPPKEVLCSLKNLQYLTIEGCYLLSSFGGVGALTSLVVLELNGCINLSTSNEPLPSSLESLTFCDCSNIDVILGESNLQVLRTLYVREINPFMKLMGVLYIGHMSCLEELHIEGWNDLLEGLNSLTALHRLHVTGCPGINSSSHMDKYAFALQEVVVDNLLPLQLMLSNETLSSIETLVIHFFQGDSKDEEIFRSLTSLKNLLIYDCIITHLPKNLKNLASLQYMHLENCPNLCKLEELPSNIRVIKFKDCPILTDNFNKASPYQVWFDKGSTIVTFP